MSFFLIFFMLFGIVSLALYGFGILKILPKSVNRLQKRAEEERTNSLKAYASSSVIVTAKTRTVREDDENLTLIEKIDDALFASGVTMEAIPFLLLNLPIVAALTFAVATFSGFPEVLSPIIAMPIWFIGLKLYLRRKKVKRQDRFQKDFIDVISTISRSVSVGSSLQESFRIVSEEFIGPVRDEFIRMRQDILFGISPKMAITRAAKRIDLSDFDFFALSVITQIEAGGNLGKSLESLRELILGRYLLIRDLKVKTSSAKFQMKFFIFMPILMGIGMYFFSPENIQYFLNDPTGKKQLKVLIGLMSFGVILSNFMTKKAMDA